ncbi:MAG: hypothetical protein HQL72_07670 [Magnetococcales bacterium]|nr:hypothetical protein [Magnetococcales bacterium]
MTGPNTKKPPTHQDESSGKTGNQAQSAAHLNRSWEMAESGLYKEAVVLWEHAARLASTPLDVTPLLVWLINSQQIVQAAKLYFAHATTLQQRHPQLEKKLLSLLAAHLLVNRADLKKSLPSHHPLKEDLPLAKLALAALCQGDLTKLKQSLQSLSSDSPYREFADILLSLATPLEEPERLIQALQTIPASSPFANLARAAGIRSLSGRALARALMQIPQVDQTFVAHLLGIPTPIIDQINQLSTCHKSAHFLQALLDHPSPLTGPWIRPTFLDLLVDDLGKRAAVEERIGPFSKTENARLLALHHQRKKNRVRTRTYWKQYRSLIKKQPDSRNRSLTLAQIASHFATLEESTHWPSRVHIIEHLQEARGWDPEDSALLLRLIHWHQQDEDRVAYYSLIEEALKQFPTNPDILLAASEAAIQRKAYKKALGLITAAAKLEPNNQETLSRQRVAQTLLARKQIKQGRLNLARKGLAHIRPLAQNRATESHLCILQAILESLSGNTDAETAFLEQGKKLAASGPLFPLTLLLEAGEMGLAKSRIYDYLNRLELECQTPPNRTETKKIITLAKDHFARKNPLVSESFDRLKRYLSKGSRLDFSKKEADTLCNDLFQIKQFSLLKSFAESAQKRWKGEPAFLFFRLYAESGGETYRISDEDFFALRDALPTAVRRGDDLTAQRIDSLMGQSPHGSRRNLGALSPAKIPKLLEKQLVKNLKKWIVSEFGQEKRTNLNNGDSLRTLLLERLANSEYASRGPFILAYLVDKALDREEGPTGQRKKREKPPIRQLEMDLFE